MIPPNILKYIWVYDITRGTTELIMLVILKEQNL